MIHFASVSSDFSINPKPLDQPGVYLFLGDGDRVLYVGEAHNLSAILYRYKGHPQRKKMRDRLAAGKFSRVASITCSTGETAPSLERFAISRYRPPWNDHHNPLPRSVASALRFDEAEQAWLTFAEITLARAAQEISAGADYV